MSQGYDQQHLQQQQPAQQIYDPNGKPHQFAPQSSDKNAPNYDPNAPPMSEGERGLLGSVGGGVAGHYLGKNTGHGFLGTVGGAILGSLMEDKVKAKKKHGKHHGSSHGGSSWGGKW
jgi:predicted lipid-binding transport protein (Tim44 family)